MSYSPMVNKTRISINIDKDIFKVIERERGRISRSAYINDFLYAVFMQMPEEEKRIEAELKAELKAQETCEC